MAYDDDKRLLELNISDMFSDDDYIYSDSPTMGSRRFPASNLSTLLPLTVVDGKLCVIYTTEA